MISGVIFTTLRVLVNDRCYPLRFPQEEIAAPGTSEPWLNKPTWPAIRYTLGGTNEATICGTDTTVTDDTRAVIDAVALTYGAMVTLRDQIIVALQTTDPPCYRDGEMFELWDAETKTHRCILTYLFFASSPGGVSP